LNGQINQVAAQLATSYRFGMFKLVVQFGVLAYFGWKAYRLLKSKIWPLIQTYKAQNEQKLKDR